MSLSRRALLSLSLPAVATLCLGDSAEARRRRRRRGRGPSFEVIDLGALTAGQPSCACGINPLGQVVGYVGGASGYPQSSGGPAAANAAQDLLRAVRWNPDGSARDLGGPWDRSQEARRINRNGRIVGGPVGNGWGPAFFWDGSRGMIDLPTLGGSGTYAYDINDLDQVVGTGLTAAGIRSAFRWSEAAGLEALPVNGWAATSAFRINSAGLIAGEAASADGTIRRAVVWQGGQAQLLESFNTNSSALAINEAGRAVGYLESRGSIQPVAWEEGSGPVWLGAGGAVPLAVNNLGDAVGFNPWTVDTPVLWQRRGRRSGAFDLNSLVSSRSEWWITRAYDIADTGEISGAAIIDGEQRAVRLVRNW